MMILFEPISYNDKPVFYSELRSELGAMLQRTWFTNLANASAALMAHMPRLNWAGFYLLCDQDLWLGPFQGLPACLKIAMGKGVCGMAAATRTTQLVNDVHAFPGHIACDARSRSEIVVPLVLGSRLLGVLDVDSPDLARFDLEDQTGLEILAQELIRGTEWPTEFLPHK